VAETRKRYWQLSANIRNPVLLIAFFLNRQLTLEWAVGFLLIAPLVFTAIHTLRAREKFSGTRDKLLYIIAASAMIWLLGALYLVLIMWIRYRRFAPSEPDPSRVIAPEFDEYLFQ
jgi:hypothetical protein